MNVEREKEMRSEEEEVLLRDLRNGEREGERVERK